MTVIAAAITEEDGVVIVGDSEITYDWTKDNDGYSKVWVADSQSYIFGSCGSLRVMQILKHWVEWPYFHDHHEDIESFVVREVIPKVRDSLFEHGAMEVSKKTENFDGDIIMAWDDNLVVIDGSLSVQIPISGRYAIGSGMQESLGALGNEGPWTKEDVIEAARRATITALGVGGPLWVATTDSMTVEKV